MQSLKLFTAAFLALSLQSVFARPKFIQEQDLAYYKRFLHGCHDGFETLLSMLGYYEDEEVKEALESETLIINAEDEEHQTEIKIVGLVLHDDEQPEITDLYDLWDEEDIDTDEFHEILGLRGFNATFKTADHKWVARQENIKAILTVRDNPDKYVESWLVAAPFMEILQQRPFVWMDTVEVLLPSFKAEYTMETTGGNPEDYLNPEVLRQSYLDYVKNVQDTIPSERLLTFNVKQGWEPLCNYLKIPIPEGIPFPHVHTRAKLEGEMYFLRMITWI